MKVEINNIELAPWAPLRGEYKIFPRFTNRTAQDILSRWIPIFKDCEQLTISLQVALINIYPEGAGVVYQH